MVAQLKGALEENVLCALCYNEECAAQLLLLITPDMFDTPGKRKIAERAMEYIRKYNQPPGRHLYDLFADETRQQNASGLVYRETFKAIDELATHLQPKYVMDMLGTFIETARVRKLLDNATTALASGDVEGAKLALVAKDAQVSFSHGTWLHRPEEMLRFLSRALDEDLYSSGIDELDARNVRPSRKTIIALVAPPKGGKTWYLINQGKKNLARRKTVLHLTCENSEELTAKRYIMALYAMSTHQLTNVRLPFFDRIEGGGVSLRFDVLDNDPIVINESQRSTIAAKLIQLDKRPRLLIKEFASGTLTVPMIVAFLDMLERSEGFVPDLLIVDYPKMMRLDPHNYRLDLGRVLIELRGIAVNRNMAVSTVMQGSKLSKTAHIVSSRMVAEDYSIVGTADTILTYSQTPEEKDRGLARILVDAARDAPDAFLVMISQSYDTGQFALDSVFMTKHLETEAERATGPGKREDDAEDQDEAGEHL